MKTKIVDGAKKRGKDIMDLLRRQIDNKGKKRITAEG
jgi:hypothetical protein